MTDKKSKPETAVEEAMLSENTVPAFQFTDLIIKIVDERFYVNKDQLVKESPVFLAMLTGNFKEKGATEIELQDKDPAAFSHFLRHTLPGFTGLGMSEKMAHLILPLAHKYQTDTTLLKIDTVLASSLNEKKYKNINELIDDILEAELYAQPKYLQACINKAYTTHSYKQLTNEPKFQNVSNDTKFTVLSKRCEKLESGNKEFLQEIDNIDICFVCRHEKFRIIDVARKILGQ